MEPLAFRDAAEWESWLAEHYAVRSDVWLKIAKKDSGLASVTPAEATEVALCYGWIDSHRKAHDESHFLQRYSPRRPGSPWSRVNVERVEALFAAGRMRTPGIAQIEAAKADGRWDMAYESQRNATVSADLAAALEGNERAGRFFASLAKTDQYLVILGLSKARTTATRAARLRRTIAALEAGRKVR